MINIWKKVIYIADNIVNILIILCFLPVLFYGVYAVWDSKQIYHHADASLYESYRPASEDKMSFEALQKINPEVFGWLIVNGTHVNYPLVQASNNSKYVNTDAKGEFSLSGSLFLDSRNQKNFSDINNIIYGHNMEKKAMFGELKDFENKEFFEKHKYGELYYEDKWHKIEFFAFLYADAYDSVLYNTGLYGIDDYKMYLEYVKRKAEHFRNLPFQPEDHFVALSTCSSNSTNGRHILIGRITDKTENMS
ncbi:MULTISPECIES: class B sortase [Clostridium]|uniref:Class B sortase n=1 Tax=Clostridium perfringens TaxID=1502 RepID=A0AAN5NAK9_CLOPF|nr:MULTISPECIES: class B sortase [Clostridium]AQW25809.1 SrtB family sortase [Clostridium perfringens]ASY50614.1 SrtB family sortase [Clostridium perfringens]AWS25113.1 SrtB family sortase [Clostridium perfringens]EGT3618489.1 class B sortase [Clostridium perfringens]EGT4141978.1 class B sortase [Clostridium perfringens]